MEDQQIESVHCPPITIHIKYLGSGSLIGKLCEVLQEKGLLQYCGVLEPEKIIFMIESVHHEVNLYYEINRVRDVLKIPENKITVNFES